MSDLSDISKALNFGKDYLLRSGVMDAELSAELLLSEVADLNRQSLYSHFEDKLTDEQQKQYKVYINRRAKHEPVQYILGYAYFRGLKIQVEPGVLIPRPETEQLVEIAKKHVANDNFKVLDLCTGSGCISCSLANEYGGSKIIATDVSEDALKFANKNVKELNLSNQIKLVRCNMADDVDETDFDLIISNPPYIPTKVYEGLDNEVINFEPKIALEAGNDGLLYLEQIINIAKEKLKPNGYVVLELHEDSIDAAKQKFQDASFKDAKIYQDFAGKFRYLIAKFG